MIRKTFSKNKLSNKKENIKRNIVDKNELRSFENLNVKMDETTRILIFSSDFHSHTHANLSNKKSGNFHGSFINSYRIIGRWS